MSVGLGELLVWDETSQGYVNEKGQVVAGKSGKTWEELGYGMGELSFVDWDPVSKTFEEVDENGRLKYDIEGKSLKGFKTGLGKLEILDLETQEVCYERPLP